MKYATYFGAIAMGALLLMASAPGISHANEQSLAVLPGEHRSTLETIRGQCPRLAAIVERFVAQDLGEEFPNQSVRPLTPELAQVATFAALGNSELTRRHASYARAAGATRYEFEELLYLTAVYAGAPKAIEATRALLDFLTEHPEA